jgi:inosine/xanthosine triphosphatase
MRNENLERKAVMRIVLASTNRAKLGAAHAVARRVFTDVDVRGVLVEGDLPAQPIGDEHTQAAAITRARAAVTLGDADLGVGLEGGLRETLGGWALCSWAAVTDPAGTLGVGGGGIVLLPPNVVERVLAGEELGPVMDELAQAVDTRHGPGASGILTGGLLNRQHIFEDALICALVPWLHPAFSRG